MKKNYVSVFSIITLITILYNQQALTANFISKCTAEISGYNKTLTQQNYRNDELPIIIIADNLKGNYPYDATFTGDVNINYGNSWLQADKVQLHQKKRKNNTQSFRTISAIGNIRYKDNKIILKGRRSWSNLNTEDINIWEGDYQILSHQGHGKAALIKQRCKKRYTIFKNSFFTSCMPDFNIWSLAGSKMVYDTEENIIKIWNARFKIGQIPIFYSPYLQLPIKNKRHSGFLMPYAKYNNTNCFEFYFPYYKNISSNTDITITPHYIHKYGNIIWENEFRYLTQVGTGLMEFHYLPVIDKLFKKNNLIQINHPRWLYYWQHSGVINNAWRFHVNSTKVSDPYYFNDFSVKYGSRSDSHIIQLLSVAYTTQHFTSTASIRQFQVLNDQPSDIYDAFPQFDVNWNRNNVGPFDMRIYGQVISFKNTNNKMPKATRVHFESSIILPWSNDWANMNSEVKFMNTYYQQKNLDEYNIANNTDLKKSINRTLPLFKIGGKLIFKRNIIIPGHYTQTLEPQMQYLYIPYRDQSKINNYDSSFLPIDYNGLFRDYSYSGLDRITPANHITTGITSRILNNSATELFKFSFGYIYNLTPKCNNTEIIHWEFNEEAGPQILVGETCWRINNYWDVHGDIQYHPRLNNVMTSRASIEYLRGKNQMVKLTYRHASQKYIQKSLTKYVTEEPYIQTISQIGGIVNWPIANQWSAIGSYYFNTNIHKVINQNLGIQYNSCCLGFRLGYERKLNSWNINMNQNHYYSGITLNIELRGL